jgi:protocatechuate 3,4-dioxygenase beta subunit
MKRIFPLCGLLLLALGCLKNGRAEEVSGHIITPDEKPVAARLFYSPPGGWITDWREIEVTADGTFRFEAEPPKTVAGNIRAADPGRLLAWSQKYGVAGERLKPGVENTIRFGETRAIEGTLRDDKGQPVANATVRVRFFYPPRNADADEHFFNVFFLPPALEREYSAHTDAKGLWQIGGLPKNASVQVGLDDPKYLSAGRQFQPEGQNGPDGDSLKAVSAGQIAGRVLDENNAPAADVRVVAVPQTGQKEARQNWGGGIQTDAAGRYTIPSLAAGVYNVVVITLPYLSVRTDDKKPADNAKSRTARAIEGVRVEAGQTASADDLKLIAPAFVKGRVLDRDSGVPLKGVYVAAYNATTPRSGEQFPLTLTDNEGRFEIALAPGPAALYVVERNSFSRETKKEAPEETRVDLAPGETKTQSLFFTPQSVALAGRAVDESGAPVTDAQITIGREPHSGSIAYTGENGAFEFPSLELGNMMVSVRGRRGAAYDLVSPKTLTLSRAGAKAPLKIVLHRVPTMELAGRVVTPQGVPVAGVSVNYRLDIKMDNGNSGWTTRKDTTDASGHFSLGKARTSETASLITAEKRGYNLQSGGKVTVQNGAAKISDIVLQPLTKSLSGTVRDSSGNPAAGALVRASGDEYSQQAITDAAGRFTLDAQPDGTLGVLAARGYAVARQRARAGDAVELQLTVEQPENFPDVSRAASAFQQAADLQIDRRTLEKSAAALAPFDPDTALTLEMQAGQQTDTRKTLPDSPDQSRLVVLRSLLRAGTENAQWPQNQAWALAQLDAIKNEDAWNEAATRLALEVAENDAPLAEQIFERAKKRRLRNGGVGDDAAALARLAAVALRLQKPEAETLHQAALKTAGADLKNVIASFALASPNWVDEAIATLPVATQLSKLDDAIRIMASWNPTGASELLDRMARILAASPKATRDLWSATFAWDSKYVIRAIGPTDAQAAHEIARAVDDDWNRAAALALAAQFGSDDERIALAQEAAAEGGPMNMNGTLARLGALLNAGNAGTQAQKAGAEIFQRAKTKIELERRERGNAYGLAEYAFYLSATDPALARMELEAQWSQITKRHEAQEYSNGFGIDSAWEGTQIAAAMAAIDFNRALEMASDLPAERKQEGSYSPRAKALSDIGRIALTPPEARWKFSWGDESGFDLR